MPRKKVESCILGTTSLLYHCLEKGLSVAFVLRNVGVLLIEGSTVQMRFYQDFLEKVSREMVQDRATLKVSLLFPPMLGQSPSSSPALLAHGSGQAGARFQQLHLP